jgi:hypothetical protein
MSMNQLEQVLNQLPHLQYLTLTLSGQQDLLDGYRWQILTNDLVLKSFSTSFWLEQKRWYTAYDGQCLFTTPRCIPNHIALPEQEQLLTISTDDSSICDSITKLTLNTDSFIGMHRFRYVKTLDLQCSPSMELFTSIVDQNRVECLSIFTLEDLFKFLPLESAWPNLSRLSIRQTIKIKSIMSFRGQQLKSIRRLELSLVNEHGNYMIEELCRLFPSVEHLCMLRLTSTNMMIHSIDSFQYLSSASFYTDSSFSKRESLCCRNPTLFINKSHRLTNNEATCRVYHTINSQMSLLIYWTIELKVGIVQV